MNLLLYAYDAASRHHKSARSWWLELLNGTEPVALAWVVLLGFLRVSTQARVWTQPFSAAEACGHMRSWLELPQVSIVAPGPDHARILFGMVERLGIGGNLTTDAHLAALAIEYQAQLHSADADFARFPGLRWHNPLRANL